MSYREILAKWDAMGLKTPKAPTELTTPVPTVNSNIVKIPQTTPVMVKPMSVHPIKTVPIPKPAKPVKPNYKINYKHKTGTDTSVAPSGSGAYFYYIYF